ncbi:MAG: hypothetical protein IBJ18_12635 [Phycisphaerales bacterium]|nr:hypothetical protein [Phycisphaerales bacterium]
MALKPRTKKILLIAGLSVGVLAVGAVIAVPMIASAMAPGIIQNAAADSIKGSLRVSDVSVGWTGPTRIGSIELLDDKGLVVAKLQATSSLGILSVLGGLTDLGTLTLSGSADIIARQTDTTAVESNFQRAIAPKNPTTSSASTAPSPLPEKTVRIDITNIDIKYTQLDRAGATIASAQITALKGNAAVDLRRGQPALAINLTGGIKQPSQPDGSIKIATKAQNFLSSQGLLDLPAATIDSDVQITAAPVGLIDALASLNGQLREALGPGADLRLKAQGSAQQAAIDLTLTSAGALVDGSMKITSGYLELTKPLTADLRSTDFLLRSPAINKALTNANLVIDAAPAARVSITSLRVPTTTSPTGFDARGVAIIASASVDPIAAQLTTTDSTGTRQRPVRTSELTLTVESPDLTKGLTVRGGGKAAIDSTPAGDLTINIAASDLLTDRGTLRPIPGQIQAEAALMNVDTRLAQPLLGDLSQKINLTQELGPRLDLRATAKAAAANPNAIEADLSVKAQNISANLPIVVDNASLRTRSDLAVSINRTSNILNAFLIDQGVVVSGTGAATLVGTFTLPRTSTGSFATPALTSSLAFDLAALDAAITREGQTRRVGINGLKAILSTAPNAPTKLQAQASGSDGWSFTTDLQLQGLLPASASSTPASSSLPFLAARRVTGTLRLSSLPTKYAALSGFDESKLRTIADVLGPSLSTDITLQSTAAQQQLAVTLAATNLSTQLAATLSENAATLNTLQGTLRLTPESAQAITTLLEKSTPETRVSSTGDLNFKVTLSKPIAITPAANTFDFSAVAINAAVSSPEGLRVTNFPLGPSRTFTGGVRNLQLTADAPLAALTNPTSKEGHLGAQLRADLIEGQRPEPVASISADFDAAASLNEFKLQTTITNIDAQRLDAMLSKPGLISGALGSPASINLSATKEGPGTTKASASIQSPRLNLTGLSLTQQGKALALTAPAEFTWTVEPAFLDQTLFAPSEATANKPAAGESLRVTQPVTLKGTIETLALGIDGIGLFQPGTFALDAALSASTIKLTSPSTAAAKPTPPGARVATMQPPEQTDIEGFTVRIKGDTNLSVKATATRVSTTASNATAASTPSPAGSLSADVLVKNFASPAGDLDLSRALIDAKIDAPSLPTALVDKLARTGKQLRDILGPEMSIALNAKNLTTSQPTTTSTTNNTSSTPGSLEARLTSVKPIDAPKQPAAPGTTPAAPSPRQQANLELSGPVDRGVLKVSPQKPLSISLAQLKFESDTEIMGVLPLFASIQKTAGTTIQPATPTQPAILEPPFTVTSPDLMIPIDGDITKLNGNLTITPGRIEYVFKRELGSFLDRALLTDGELMQRPIPPFVVSFNNGIASYTDVRLPIRNFEFKLTGKVDLVRKEVDAVIYIPTVAASASIMSKLNDDLGKGFGGILPDVLSEGTMVPLRVTGPLSSPAYAPDPKLFFENFGSQLKKPADLIGKGIERGLGELFKPRDDKDKDKPK